MRKDACVLESEYGFFSHTGFPTTFSKRFWVNCNMLFCSKNISIENFSFKKKDDQKWMGFSTKYYKEGVTNL